jgi:hypothetical protein
MNSIHVRSASGALAFSWLLTGCFYISPEDLDARLAFDAADADTDTDTDVDTDTHCDADEDGSYGCGGPDCNDEDADIAPGVPEVCDGVDQDCDEAIDEDATDARTWYRDEDGDGSGTAPVVACDQPADSVDNGRDCDDTNPQVSPDATDVCNGIDDNCDDSVDDGTMPVPSRYTTIQSALDTAPDNAVVCVAPGTYTERLDFGASASVLVGSGVGVTIVDGGGEGPVVSATHAVARPTLRDLTITGGAAGTGAGLYVDGAGIVLEDVTITGNTCDEATCTGVGAYLVGAVTLTDVVITDNEAALVQAEAARAHGVGAFVSGTGTLTRVTISDNRAIADDGSPFVEVYGVGAYLSDTELELVDVAISGNVGTGGDNGVAADGALTLDQDDSIVDGLTVEDNAWEFTGTAYCVAPGVFAIDSTTVMTHLRVADNRSTCATNMGVGMYIFRDSVLDVTNAQILGNSAESTGSAFGAVDLESGATATFTNVDVVGNTLSGTNAQGGGFYVGGLSTLNLRNVSIVDNELDASVFADGGAIYVGTGSALEAIYSNIYGNSVAEVSGPLVDGVGMLAVEPGYTNVTGAVSTWDLTLQSGSALIDAGDPAETYFDVDGSRGDMGAFGGPAGAW